MLTSLLSLLRYAECFQYCAKWTELGNPELKEVGPDKSGKEQPVGTVKEWACLDTQCKTHQDKCTSNKVNPIRYDHCVNLINNSKIRDEK